MTLKHKESTGLTVLMWVTVQIEQHKMTLRTTSYALFLTFSTTSKYGFIILILQKGKQKRVRDINQFSKDSHLVGKRENLNVSFLLPIYVLLSHCASSVHDDEL